MEKIKLVIAGFLLLALSSFAIEAETREYKKVKNNGLFGIVDKSTNETIIPFEYKKIKKQKSGAFRVKNQNKNWQIITEENKSVPEGEFNKVKIFKNNYYGIYNKHNRTTHISSFDFASKDFLKEIYEQNNKLSKIKFYNYPSEGVLILKKKDKYGFLSIGKDKIIFVPPKYKDIYVPDNNTSIFKILGISYSDIKDIKVHDGYYWLGFDERGKLKSNLSYLARKASLSIDEEVKIEDNNVVFNFKSKSDLLKNVALTGFPKESDIGIGKILSYPKNRIEILNDSLKIYSDNNSYSISRNNYEDFYFQDSNTIIYNIKNISFSDPDRIFAKKEGLWGVIDKNEKVIVDFQYEDVFALSAKEDMKLTKTGNKYDIEYKNIIFPKNNIFFVKKDGLYGVITSEGKLLIPFGRITDKEQLKNVLNESNKKVSKKILKKYKKFEKAPIQEYYPQKTTTEILISRPYTMNSTVIPSFIPYIPVASFDKKVLKKAL